MAWDNMAPVGVEFASPDYERLMQEHFEKKQGIFDPRLSAARQAPRVPHLNL